MLDDSEPPWHRTKPQVKVRFKCEKRAFSLISSNSDEHTQTSIFCNDWIHIDDVGNSYKGNTRWWDWLYRWVSELSVALIDWLIDWLPFCNFVIFSPHDILTLSLTATAYHPRKPPNPSSSPPSLLDYRSIIKTRRSNFVFPMPVIHENRKLSLVYFLSKYYAMFMLLRCSLKASWRIFTAFNILRKHDGFFGHFLCGGTVLCTTWKKSDVPVGLSFFCFEFLFFVIFKWKLMDKDLI